MLLFAPKALLLLSSFLLISSLFFSFPPFAAAAHLGRLQTVHNPGWGEGDGIGLYSRRGLVGEEIASGPSDISAENTSFVLAAERTHRKDPLEGYKRYAGGWNISDQHYWASVGFTAAPLFVIAIVWFLVFGLSLLLIACCYCCCRGRSHGYSQAIYTFSLVILIFFTVAAITGSILLYTGQGKFHGSVSDTLDYVVEQSNFTVDNLRNFSDNLAAAKRVRVDEVFMPTDVQTRIDDIKTKLNVSANFLADRTESNSKKIHDVLDIVVLDLIIIAAVMLFLAFIGFLFSVLGLQVIVYVLVLIGWFLVAGTLILCGVFLLFHNVIADTCVAMDEWVLHPHEHTALDDILPCVDVATANESLYRSREVTSQMVNLVNQVLTNVSNVDFPPGYEPLYFNQSGPLVPLLCNPFSPSMDQRKCETGEVDFDNATQVWRDYTCQVSSTGICITVGRISPDIYNQMTVAVNISFALYHYSPFLVGLQDCTFVRDTFAYVSRKNCPGLQLDTEWIYIGLLMVSAAVMLSLIFWIIHARERRRRKYSAQFIQSDEFQAKGS
ncbi:transmembrane protein [Cinnamomum micranthum f. kanehirae]|uniref:Transmembrane protein n=1 Tax=Cinnamomum micranthum f. kanehirae TaxID=337451 RepID=A0A3S3PI19_9MAGN|nr:transmembrane protein [Cinnamomum micranthum f. kanehirae]